MEHWQIHSLPGACSTTYKLLYSEADLAFVLICGGVALVGVIVLVRKAWRAYIRKDRNDLAVYAMLLMGFSGMLVYSEWRDYQADQAILRNAATAPGMILDVSLSEGKRPVYKGYYSFRYGQQQYYGMVVLPKPQASSHKAYYTKRQYTVLFSQANPTNSKLDIYCPAGPAE